MKLNTLEIEKRNLPFCGQSQLEFSRDQKTTLYFDPLELPRTHVQQSIFHHPRTPACGFSFFLDDCFLFIYFYSTFFIQVWFN